MAFVTVRFINSSSLTKWVCFFILLPLPGWTMVWLTGEQQLVELPAPTCSLKLQGADCNVQYSASAPAVAWSRCGTLPLYVCCTHSPSTANWDLQLHCRGLSACVNCNLMPSASLSKPCQTLGLECYYSTLKVGVSCV